MRVRDQWVVLVALLFPVGLVACSSGSISSSATAAPATTAAAPTATATAVPVTAATALNGAFDNVGISDDADPAAGNLDGGGYSYSAQALAAVGLAPGASITHDGLTFTWPDVPAGLPDNVLASGQTIAVSGSGTLGFLGASDYYSSSGTGTITYTDGTTQSFTLSLADWWANDAAPGGDILASVPYMNTSTGQMNQQVSVYYVAVPLQAGKAMQYVTLPDVSQQAVQGSPAMHIFAVTISSPSTGDAFTQVADMIWQIVDSGNTVCEILQCKFVPPNVSDLISRIGQAETIGSLVDAVRESVIVGNDLSALTAAIKGHVPGTPFSSAVKGLAGRAWNDTRALQQTLEGLVPGLSVLWPVPPAK